MAHKVTFSIPERELGREDVEFSVNQVGSKVSKLGTLKISKGTLVWVPTDHTYGHKIGLKEFDAIMKEKGKKEK